MLNIVKLLPIAHKTLNVIIIYPPKVAHEGGSKRVCSDQSNEYGAYVITIPSKGEKTKQKILF